MILKIRSLLNLFQLAIRGQERDFTSGSVNRAAFLLAVPTMLELGMESLFVIVDLFFVSSLGEQAITVVGITNSVLILIQSVAIGLGIAATAVVSRRVGERKPAEAGSAAMQVIYLGLFIAALCSSLAAVFSREILHLAGASEALVRYGNLFAKCMFAGVIFVIMRVLLNGIFRGSGDAAMAMRALLLSNFINVVLCAMLIFGLGPIPALGLMGAAIAMLAANMAGVAYQVWYLIKGNKRLIIGKEQLVLVPSLIQRLLKLGTSGTLQYLIPSSSRFLMIVIVAKLGEEVLAGYIIANRIIMFTVLPAWGIANAAGILTGQNLGAKQPDRAEQSVWRMGIFNVGFLAVIALLLLAFSEAIAGVFAHEPTILAYASEYLHYMAIAYFFFGFTMVISRSLNAAGAVNTVSLLYILMFYLTQLPLAYGLGILLDWGPKGIFTAIVISEMVLAIGCVTVFRAGKWKLVNV